MAFSGCDYLGLSHHPAVLEATRRGLSRFGLSANGSRTTTGSTAPHVDLEAALADFLGADSAVLTPDGSLANLAACEGLARRCGCAVLDERSHASLPRAARGAGMSVRPYTHASTLAAGQVLLSTTESPAGCDRLPLLMTDGLFGASGALAPVDELSQLAGRGPMLIDDSHGLGVVGPNGAGSRSLVAADTDELVISASLAKALGCYGGVVAGPHSLIDEIRLSSSAYRGCTPIPAAVAAGALAALAVIRQEQPVTRLRQNLDIVRRTCSGLGLPLPPDEVPIFCVTPEDNATEQRLLKAAEEAGILLPLIDYPGGPGSQYFRIAISAAHGAQDLERLGDVLTLALAD